MKNKFIILTIFSAIISLNLLPNKVSAAEIDISAPAYIVTDAETGRVLLEKSSDTPLTAASLTKLVAALVVLDTNPDLNKSVAITKADQTAGACGKGGGCIKAVPGVKFTVNGLFHAAMLPSANNAAAALARSTGLTNKQFASRMNAKAKALGATDSIFVEPTGMSSANKITAADYAKIMSAAFQNPYLRKVAQAFSYPLKSTNNKKYNQTIKNSNKLLTNSELKVIGGKTGYLGKYNYATVLLMGKRKISLVVLRETRMSTAYDDAKALAAKAQEILNSVATLSTP